MEITNDTSVAVVGATNNVEKYGYRVLMYLKGQGHPVVGVNPKYDDVNGVKCYPTLADIPTKPELVVTVVPPKVTEKVVEKCKELGITQVWMQPGSESDTATKFCDDNGIDVIFNACIMVQG